MGALGKNSILGLYEQGGVSSNADRQSAPFGKMASLGCII